ncbi:putative disease resistance protein At4g19050 [Quercus suber]|uniref:putative disease resistance protein At4g19050 n=1 Tax=Quercus suber TaxID=58331 RepID=UPI0032DFEC6A
MALREAEKDNILELLKDDNVTTIVLIGDAGVGKTWIARKIADSADKEDLSYVTLWVFLNQQDDKKSLDENMSLHENIARQLSVLTTIEEWEDNATKEEDHKEEDVKSLKDKISAKLKEMRLDSKFLFLIVDGVPDTMNENDIMSALTKIGQLDEQTLFKVLFTRRKKPVVEGNEVTETKSELIKIVIEPLSNEEGLSLFKKRVTENVSGIDDFQTHALRIAKKSKGLPAAIVVIAEALNRIVEHDSGVWTLESAMKEAATCEDAHNSANQLLRCGYEMLPKRDKALIDCCWYSLQFFLKHGGVHYNELIACWILEGYFGPVDHVEKVYEEGHRVLVELIDRHLLKIRDDNAVVVEGLALTILDCCPDRNEGKSSLGLARVFEGGHWQGFGRITHADGLMKTMCNRDKWDKVSTLLIDGSRLSREVLDTFFKPMKGIEVLALFNPTIKTLPSNLSEMYKLHLLVLRGCDLLENVDNIKGLESLTVLEISGATSLKKIPDDFFHKLLQLRSLKLSAVQIKSLPSSISELSELRWLMLRGCASLEELPRLQKLENLLVLDLSGAIELKKLKDKTFKAHAKLRMLDLSQTKIDRLPFLKNLGNLTQLSLRCCECLTRLPSLKSVSQLEILDLSGSSMLKENQDEIFPSMDGLKTLNLSNTRIRHLPSNNNSLPNLKSLNLSDASILDKIEDNILKHLRYLRHLELSKTNLQKLPSLSNLCNLEILNLSGCSALKEIVDESFQHMTCLQQLNLSETKIERLPSLSNLSNLCQLLLRNCVNLKELPPLESLSKLEELDLCGARSLEETEAKFLENMVHLRFLNLSGTALKLPPTSNLTNLTNLTQLLLQRCRLSELCPNLEKCTQLEVLNLSETDIQSLPSLENFSNLRDLNLRDCSRLEKLLCLKSVTHLEVLDLWGTRVKEFPYEISQLTHLKRLTLPDLKDVQTLDWGKIKNLPEELNWDQCGIFKCSQNRPCMSLSGTEFFQYLKTNPGLWETCFKEFQFSVCAHEKEGPARDICWHRVDPNFREIYFQILSLPEEHGKYLEIVGFDIFPSGVEDALQKAEYISLIDNKFIKSLSDLAAGVESINVGNVMAMKGCWLERSTEMQTIFGEKAKVLMEENLETLWASNLPILKSVSNGNLQLGHLKKLYLDCCPMLETVFHSSRLPENLEVLQIKFCDKLKTLFMPNPSTDCKLRNLQKLHLVELPNLTSIGVLRGCASLEELPRLQKLENLLVLDLSGAIELKKLKDKTFKAHAKLRMLDLSQTKIDRLPFLKNLGNLTQLSLRCCECLTRLPSLKSVSQLEILDLSGSSMLKENQDEIFPSMDGLKTLNLSNTRIRHLPSNNNSLPNLKSLNLSDASILDKIEDNILKHLRYLRHLELSKTNLQKLPSLSNLCNLEILNLSGCSALKEIVDESFQHMTCLQQLNLSETKIERLPSLSNLSNLCQLLLRNCVNLKELPPLESLSKLEELDLCGARSLEETEAKFLENMVHLRFLNLSGTELKLPPTSNLTNLTNLTQLLLQRCRLSELCPNLEKCTQLEVLNLSETDIQSLPSLENFSNLRDLNLRDCSSLEKLPCLKSVTHLEVLDLWGTRVKEFPYEISQLTYLKRLNLPDLKDVQTLDWGKIKNLPEELNWDQCGIFKCSQNRPCMSLSGTEFFQYLKTNPGLWETCFKEFQFSVCAHEKEGTARDICWHRVDLNFREIYFQILSLPEEHGKYLEIVGFDRFPSGVEDALQKAEYISLIDNKFIKSLSDLAAGVESINVGNVMAMKGCWLERSTEMQTIFGEKEVLREKNLETLWVSNLPILKSVSNGNLQLGHLKKLYLDCCPMLETVFHSSQLPENLEVLQIKFCDKLKTLFMPNPSTDCKLRNLQKLHLVELPNLTSIGVLELKSVQDIFPSIKLIKVRECPNLENLDKIKDFKSKSGNASIC